MPPELETSYIAQDIDPEKPQSDIAAISELLDGGDPEAPEPEQDAQPEQPEHAAPETDEAEPEQDSDEQTAEPGQIDYDLEIPMPDGRDPVKLGELKDFYQAHGELEQERDDWEAQQSEQQLELMATRRQLVELADMLKDVKPEVMDHVQSMIQRDDEQEAELLLKTFPAWKDADKKAAARAEQLETFKTYGFSEWEYSSIQDHRVIKALHDLSQYRKREAAGQAKREQLKADIPKGQKPPQRKRTAAQERAALIQRAKRGTPDDKIAAVSSLLSEG